MIQDMTGEGREYENRDLPSWLDLRTMITSTLVFAWVDLIVGLFCTMIGVRVAGRILEGSCASRSVSRQLTRLRRKRNRLTTESRHSLGTRRIRSNLEKRSWRKSTDDWVSSNCSWSECRNSRLDGLVRRFNLTFLFLFLYFLFWQKLRKWREY